MTYQKMPKIDFVIGQLDPDQRFCLLCQQYKHVNLMVHETSEISPLETMICEECQIAEYTKLQAKARDARGRNSQVESDAQNLIDRIDPDRIICDHCDCGFEKIQSDIDYFNYQKIISSTIRRYCDQRNIKFLCRDCIFKIEKGNTGLHGYYEKKRKHMNK